MTHRHIALRLVVWLTALLVVVGRGAGQHPAVRSTELFALTEVTVIDGTGAPPRPHQTVLVADGRIAAIYEARTWTPPEPVRIIRGRGRYLIPGLWDMHVHLSMGDPSLLPVFLAHGVTAVRDLGGDFPAVRAWQQEIATGTRIGPRIYTAGRILESPRFLEILARLASALEPPFRDQINAIRMERIPVGDAEQVERAVRDLAQQGAACIKFRMNTTPEIFHAIVAAANRVGLPLAGHSPQGVSLAEAAAAGQKSFEHVLTGPEEASLPLAEVDRLAEALKRSQSYLVPTLVTFHTSRLLAPKIMDERLNTLRQPRKPRGRSVPEPLVEAWRLQRLLDQFEPPQDWAAVYRGAVERLRHLHRAGVQFLAGTDFGARFIYPGSSLHEELERLVVEIGLTPSEALQTATRNAAQFFREEQRLGTIEVGKLADLVLLEANPLNDIRNTRRIAAVIAAGVYYDRAALERLSARTAQPTIQPRLLPTR
jgi:imidazolonepropionase-like amidohydrolase